MSCSETEIRNKEAILTFLGSILNFLRPIAKFFDFAFVLNHNKITAGRMLEEDVLSDKC